MIKTALILRDFYIARSAVVSHAVIIMHFTLSHAGKSNVLHKFYVRTTLYNAVFEIETDMFILLELVIHAS